MPGSEPHAQAEATFVDPHGATWSITLVEGCDGATAAEIVKAAEGLSAYVLKRGWSIEAASDDEISPQAAAEDPAWCAIHQAKMTRKTKNGEVWYSHKTDAGAWCRGK